MFDRYDPPTVPAPHEGALGNAMIRGRHLRRRRVAVRAAATVPLLGLLVAGALQLTGAETALVVADPAPAASCASESRATHRTGQKITQKTTRSINGKESDMNIRSTTAMAMATGMAAALTACGPTVSPTDSAALPSAPPTTQTTPPATSLPTPQASATAPVVRRCTDVIDTVTKEKLEHVRVLRGEVSCDTVQGVVKATFGGNRMTALGFRCENTSESSLRCFDGTTAAKATKLFSIGMAGARGLGSVAEALPEDGRYCGVVVERSPQAAQATVAVRAFGEPDSTYMEPRDGTRQDFFFTDETRVQVGQAVEPLRDALQTLVEVKVPAYLEVRDGFVVSLIDATHVRSEDAVIFQGCAVNH